LTSLVLAKYLVSYFFAFKSPDFETSLFGYLAVYFFLLASSYFFVGTDFVYAALEASCLISPVF
jgi:hypothetical protein